MTVAVSYLSGTEHGSIASLVAVLSWARRIEAKSGLLAVLGVLGVLGV